MPSSTSFDAVTLIMMALNVACLADYAREWIDTGAVMVPVVVVGHFLVFLHQLGIQQYQNETHTAIGQFAVMTVSVCLAMAVTALLDWCIPEQQRWAEQFVDISSENPVIKNVFLLLHEAINIHQFCFYGPLLLNQLWQGWFTATDKQFVTHEKQMRCVTKFLLGPLAQRFLFNAVFAGNDGVGVLFQIITYGVWMWILDRTTVVVRPSLRWSLVVTLVVTNLLYWQGSSVLVYLQVVVDMVKEIAARGKKPQS